MSGCWWRAWPNPATLPCPKMPKHPPKKRCSAPSRSTCCAARNRRRACPTVSSMVAEPRRLPRLRSFSLTREDLVEGVDVRLGVPRRALQRHSERPLRVVVEELVGPFLMAGVHEDLVRLLVEQRPAVHEEVVRDPGSLLHVVDEHLELALVRRLLQEHLGVHPAVEAFLRIGDLDQRPLRVLHTCV